MRAAKNQVRYLGAAGVLLAGTAWAGTVYRTAPAVSGPNPAQLRTLAARLESSTPETDPLLDAAPSTGAVRISLPSVKKPSTSSGPKLNAPVLPSAGTAPAPAAEPAKPTPAPEPVNPVKSIALMGVTNRGDVETAWLVNLENQERELAAVGDRAFGMTIKDIEPEQVVLTDGNEEYLLHLGEKQIPVAQVASTADAGNGGGFDPNGGGGRRGRNGGGGWGGQGGNNSGFSGRRGSWGGGGSSNWGGGGRSSGGSYSGGASSSGSSYGSSNSGYSGRRNGGYSSNSGSSYGRSGGGYSGGGGGGYSGGGGGRGSSNSTSQFAAGSSGSTSNPQTARRRGGQLTGDTPAQPMPSAISNPQTQRRIGTSSGSAFGTQQQGQSGRNSGFSNSGRSR